MSLTIRRRALVGLAGIALLVIGIATGALWMEHRLGARVDVSDGGNASLRPGSAPSEVRDEPLEVSLTPEAIQTNNWERPGNTGVNTDGRRLGNFEAGSGAPKFLGTIPREFRGTATKFGPSARPYLRPILVRRPGRAGLRAWSQHYDISINYVGHAETWETIEIDGSLQRHDGSVRYRVGGRVLAMASIFRDRENLEAELAMEQEEVGSGRRRRPA